MIIHYLKVAVRNLLKYPTQSLISILGLAMAFACTALGVYWEHYEKTYDTFHPNGERIYRIRQAFLTGRISHGLNKEAKDLLEARYPEIESVCFSTPGYIDGINAGGKSHSGEPMLGVTPEFADMFNVEWLAGNSNLASYGEQQYAISDKLAQEVYGDVSAAVGQRFEDNNGNGYEVTAVFKKWSLHSNFIFDLLKPVRLENYADNEYRFYTYAILTSKANPQQFIEKISTDTIKQNHRLQLFDVITPLRELHYTFPMVGQNIGMEHLKLFNRAAGIVALCALLNYLTLFVSRIRTRNHNMALRVVHGASGTQLFFMLMTEYLVLLLASMLVSMLFVDIFTNTFLELTQLHITRFDVYGGSARMLGFILMCSFLLSFVPIQYFKRKSLYAHITRGRSYFRPASVCIQLMVSLTFIFCSLTMYRQIQFLLNGNIGIERKNIASIFVRRNGEECLQLIKQLPMIEEAMNTTSSLNPENGFTDLVFEAGNGLKTCSMVEINDSIARFYGIRMKEGCTSFELNGTDIIINETLARQLEQDKTLEEKVRRQGNIVGVAYDYYSKPPTQPVEPIIFTKPHENAPDFVVFKYSGDLAACRKAVEKALEGKVDRSYSRVVDAEETYYEYLKSEMNLSKLLGIITVICILIALFGVYALAVQSCEQRRKEIAIRKVNGAHMTDILKMFFKEYLLLTGIASAVAFPTGYALMKGWLESYVLQLDITVWMYAEIFIGVFVLVTLCIIWHVWRVANENPAEVVKSE